MSSDVTFSIAGKRIWVAGHRGMLGSAIVRRLATEDCDILTACREELDLRDQAATNRWVAEQKPDAVFLVAGKVGGILANDNFPVDFLSDNLLIATNVINASYRTGVAKLLYIGSSAIYPRLAPQPTSEQDLLTGPLEPTHEWYAIAKIAGLKLTQAYRRQYGADMITALPTNLYGPGANFDLAASHVVPAMLRKAHDAKLRGEASFTIWGSGTPRREFLHVDDCADACVSLLQRYSDAAPVNVGSGSDVSIAELAALVCDVVGLPDGVTTDPTKPDGPPRKLLSNRTLAALGWRPSISLRDGIAATYRWLCEQEGSNAGAE